MPRILQSSKMQAAIAGLILIIVNAAISRAPVDPNVMTAAISAIIGAYIAATAYEDGKAKEASTAASTATVATAQLAEAQLSAAQTPTTTPVVVNVAAPGEPNVTVTTPDTPPTPTIGSMGG